MDAPGNQNSRPAPTTFLVILTLFFIAAAIFLVLDFQLVAGRANSESKVSAYAFGIDEDRKLLLNQPLVVYIRESSMLEENLAAALENSLAGNPYVGTFELRPGPMESVNGSVLVVEITKPDLFWTPVCSRFNIELRAAYASDGEVHWIDQEPVILHKDHPVARVRGDYQVQGTATGLMSLPGIRAYTEQQLADQIAASLMERLSSANEE